METPPISKKSPGLIGTCKRAQSWFKRVKQDESRENGKRPKSRKHNKLKRKSRPRKKKNVGDAQKAENDDYIIKTIVSPDQENDTAIIPTAAKINAVDDIHLDEYQLKPEQSQSMALKRMTSRVKTFVKQIAMVEGSHKSKVLSNLIDEDSSLQTSPQDDSSKQTLDTSTTLINQDSTLSCISIDKNAEPKTKQQRNSLASACDARGSNYTLVNRSVVETHRNSDATDDTKISISEMEDDAGVRDFGRLHRAVVTALAVQASEPCPFKHDCKVESTKEEDALYVKYKEMKSKGKKKIISVKLHHHKEFLKLYSHDEYRDMMASFMDGWTRTGAGKSGSLLFWSGERKYVAKTLSPLEVAQGRGLIKHLLEYHTEEKKSMLVHYTAIIKVKIGNKAPVYVAIMPNVMHGFNPVKIFDLKGSLHGRSENGKSSILKDLNFLQQEKRISFKYFLDRDAWVTQLQRDAAFLEKHDRIDYSILLAFDAEDKWKCGIIDILTPFSAVKVLEYHVMGSMHGKSKISCIPPAAYANRFSAFITDATAVY